MIDPVISVPGSDVVLNCGVATPHAANQFVDWVPPCYVFMVFHTPFVAETVRGCETGQAGQVLIDAPGTREWHGGVGSEGFRNDWVHLARDAAAKPIGQAGLPLNRIFHVSDPPSLTRIIADMARERLLKAPNCDEMLACRATELILTTARSYRIARQMAGSPVEHAHYERFCAIRQKMNAEFASPWSVEALAKMAHLSPNRFAVLYRKFFQITPVDDLIRMRLEEAGRLLTQGTMTVSEIAERCGFNDLNYFSRLFKARMGRSPRQHRTGPRE